MTQLKRQKINFINSSMRISTAPELMKLIFAVVDVSSTMGLTRCYKTEGFFTFIFAVFVHISHYFY